MNGELYQAFFKAQKETAFYLKARLKRFLSIFESRVLWLLRIERSSFKDAANWNEPWSRSSSERTSSTVMHLSNNITISS